MKAAAIILMTIMIGLSGCANGSSTALSGVETENRQSASDEVMTRKGLDRDNNGIRDDVDAFISGLSTNGKGLETVKAYARGQQRIQTEKTLSLDDGSEILDSYAGLMFCAIIGSQVDSKVFTRIESLTANTSARKKRKNEYDRMFAKLSYSQPSIRECAELTSSPPLSRSATTEEDSFRSF